MVQQKFCFLLFFSFFIEFLFFNFFFFPQNQLIIKITHPFYLFSHYLRSPFDVLIHSHLKLLVFLLRHCTFIFQIAFHYTPIPLRSAFSKRHSFLKKIKKTFLNLWSFIKILFFYCVHLCVIIKNWIFFSDKSYLNIQNRLILSKNLFSVSQTRFTFWRFCFSFSKKTIF